MSSSCSVCDARPAAGCEPLACAHRFCPACFSRYVRGSLDELLHHLRCSICGEVTVLTTETKTEVVTRRFGRDLAPKLHRPIGFAQRLDGSYVTVDAHSRRALVFNRHGHLKTDFSYVHKYEPQHGIVVNLSDEIVIPFSHGDHKLLGYYTPSGHFIGNMYLPSAAADVRHLAVNGKNEVLVTDADAACIYVVHERRRVVRTLPLAQMPVDRFRPEPHGVACTAAGLGGHIVVTDRANHCVKVLSSDGQLVRQFGSRGQRPGQFERPAGVCVDTRGRLLVADEGNHRVQLFTSEGVFLHFIVRYNEGDDVYMAPVDLLPLPNNMVAVLLRGDANSAPAAEIRVYSCVQTY